MTRYSAGAAFEREVKRWLEDRGWLVIRSAGSHGIADLVALQRGRRTRLIQCKIGKSAFNAADAEALRAAAHAAGAIGVLVRRRPRQAWEWRRV